MWARWNCSRPTSAVLDGIGNSDGGAVTSTDLVYAPRLTPLSTSTNAADAIVRFPGNTTPMSADAYYYGLIAVATGAPPTGNQTLTFDLTEGTGRRSANFPTGGIVTPYETNAPVVADTTAPTVVSAAFDPRNGQKIVVTFSEDVGASLAASDFTLTNTTTGASVTLTASAATNGGTTVTLTFTNAGGPKDFILNTGHYELKVLVGQVADTSPAMCWQPPRRRRSVSRTATSTSAVTSTSTTSSCWAQNYNKTGQTFATGDLNYDGTVNFDDLIILAQNYGKTVPASAMAVVSSLLTGKSLPTATATPVKASPTTKKDSVLSTPATPVLVTTPVKTPFASGKKIA